jgi:hypothetical protein
MFDSLKKALSCVDLVVHWFQQQPKEFFVEEIHWLVHQWDACVSAHWDYF